MKEKLNIKCREFQLSSQMIAMETNLTITMTYCNWKQELCTTETFRNRFFDSNRQRKTPTVIRRLLSIAQSTRFCAQTYFFM